MGVTDDIRRGAQAAVQPIYVVVEVVGVVTDPVCMHAHAGPAQVQPQRQAARGAAAAAGLRGARETEFQGIYKP